MVRALGVFIGICVMIIRGTESREMCYTCSYTINALKQGMECVDAPKNVTIGQWASQCPYKCLIMSEITIETMEIRSFNRMCGFDQGEDRCEEHGPYEICYGTCEEDFCNHGIMGLLKGVVEDDGSGGHRCETSAWALVSVLILLSFAS